MSHVPVTAASGAEIFCITVVVCPAALVRTPVSVPIALTVPLTFANLVRLSVPANVPPPTTEPTTGSWVGLAGAAAAVDVSGMIIVAKARIVAAAILFIIIFSVILSAFGTYMLSSVLSNFPREIIEAAEIDGASSWQVLWLVVVPVLRPTLMVVGTFFFIWTWNEFLIPLVMLVSNNNQTVSVAMGLTRGQNLSDPVLQAAASLLGIAPTVIFFLIFQRTLTRGVVVGAVK